MGVKVRQKGIVLVTVLLMSILIAMFIGAAILIGPRTLGLAGSQDGALTGSAAAESGMQYAIMRVRENPDWRGDGGGLVINTADFKVVEDSGYVWGHMKAPDGSASMFRIRFNFENGNDNGDSLNDSTGPRIPIDFVSINNLSNSSEKVVPRASNGTVADPSVGEYYVPAHALCIIVEGLTGPGVREFDPGNPNPNGLTHGKVLEGIFIASNLDDLATDAVAMSNSDLVAVLGDKKLFTVEAKGGGVPKVRSRGGVKVSEEDGDSGTYDSKGTVYTKDATLDAEYDPGKVGVEQEKADDPFYELTWDDLKTADPDGNKVAAGTYVWWDDGTLHYYDMDYASFSSHIRGNPTDAGEVVFSGGTWTGGPSGMTLPPSLKVETKKMTITGDLYVKPTVAGTADFTVIPREGAPEEPPDPSAAQATAAGPALAQYLAGNPVARTAFFAGRLGDGSGPTGNEGWNSAPESGSAADIWWTSAGVVSFDDANDYSSLQAALEDAFDDGFVTPGELTSTAATHGLLGAEGDLNLGTGDTTTAEDLEINFEPPDGESATLSSDGNIRIGAKLKGEGASITSQGSLSVVGAGADLSATANAEEGVNMYAKGDITLSTLKDKGNDQYEFKDIKLKGLVYTWGDFDAKMGNDDPSVKRGKFSLEGTLVAYGGDPANGKPANTNKGLVNIDAEEVKLKFDPAYLLSVMKTLPDNVQFKRTAWTAYR